MFQEPYRSHNERHGLVVRQIRMMPLRAVRRSFAGLPVRRFCDGSSVLRRSSCPSVNSPASMPGRVILQLASSVTRTRLLDRDLGHQPQSEVRRAVHRLDVKDREVRPLFSR